jgi:hypothetical protein
MPRRLIAFSQASPPYLGKRGPKKRENDPFFLENTNALFPKKEIS